MLVRSQIAGQKQILWIFGYTEGKNRLILSLGLGGIIQERGVGLKYPFLVGFSPFSAPLVAHCSLVYTLSPPVGRQPEQKGRCLHFLPGGINFQINHRNQMQRHICTVYNHPLNVTLLVVDGLVISSCFMQIFSVSVQLKACSGLFVHLACVALVTFFPLSRLFAVMTLMRWVVRRLLP